MKEDHVMSHDLVFGVLLFQMSGQVWMIREVKQNHPDGVVLGYCLPTVTGTKTL